MDIFSALRSWRSKGSKLDLNESSRLPLGSMSPRFTRWGSVKRQSKNRRQRHSKLSVCRENQSQSLPSSVCGDSDWDLKVSTYRREDFLDPLQGKCQDIHNIFKVPSTYCKNDFLQHIRLLTCNEFSVD